MKSSRNLFLWAAALTAGVALSRADLPEWIQNIEAGGRLEAIFYRPMPLPSGAVVGRRPPRETRQALTQALGTAQSDAELLAMRAREAELALDFAAAESDWKRYAEAAEDYLELADFYHRRLRPADEIEALSVLARTPDRPEEKLLPAHQQRSWKAFARLIGIIDAQAMAPETEARYRLAWIDRYSRESALYRSLFEFYLSHNRLSEAEQLIGRYSKTFSADAGYPIRARAALARQRGSETQALAVYDRAFEPLMSWDVLEAYFALLDETRTARQFYEQARAGLAADPDNLNAAARLFHHYQRRKNSAEAQRVLIEFRLRKESRGEVWTPDERRTLALLAERGKLYEEAARHWYEIHRSAGAAPQYREQALAGMARVLLTAPEQPMPLGSGDLSFYRDIATMDPYPGLLNGILSLLFNSSYPEGEYARQDSASVAYFHRAKASEVLRMLDAQFPNSPERPPLHTALIDAYAAYGDSTGVLRVGEAFLKAFPSAAQRTQVSLLMAEAYARTNRPDQEFRIYEAVLNELSGLADRVPLGEGTAPAPAPADSGPRRPQTVAPARSPEYARVLDRYISRLVSLKRIRDALALYARQIELNKNDPGLYERLAAFLEQNRMGAETEQVYRRAIAQFNGRSWYEKLARWYLRGKQTAAFEKLTREVVSTFEGSELEQYFRSVLPQAGLDAVLYRQVNLYAHRRFPHNLHFVHNLLTAYRTRGTADPAAWERLARANWQNDPVIRSQYFERLSSSGRLEKELEAAGAPKAADNPAAAQFVAEGEAWLSHFERSAPIMQNLSAEFPGSFPIGARAASVHRSLAESGPRPQPQLAQAAVAIEENLHRFRPRDTDTLARIGEIHADRYDFAKAKPYWNRIASVEPGKAAGYLAAATVFWDYYQFDDAMRLIAEARAKVGPPSLFAYEAGAIAENQRDFERAIAEYVKGSLAAGGAESPSRRRLLVLAKRPAHRALIESATSTGADASAEAVGLRAAVFEVQSRRDDLREFLLGVTARASEPEMLNRVEQIAARHELDNVQLATLERRIAIESDAVSRLALRLQLARFHEGHGQVADARRVVEAIYQEKPRVLGVVRAATDFYWRNKLADRAIGVLESAAGSAHDALKRQFLFEAARKSTEAAQYDRARKLLSDLLQSDPFHAEYMAAMAATYARQGDPSGLEQFYSAKLKELGAANLPLGERTSRMASLRRGLIPALTQQKSFASAIDQYIELVKAFPQDEALLREAGVYASRYGRRDQLLAYFRKAAADSPKDVRWPVTLARLETQFEMPADAIADYVKASEIRPDRTELLVERASVEERLLRFADAARTYTRLYELTYRNPQWMERVAEQRARLGETQAAVEALRLAFIANRPERPESHLQIAERLESWNILTAAAQHAERGMELARNDPGALMQVSPMYARMLTRLRRHEAAIDQLNTLGRRPDGGNSLTEAMAEIGRTAARYFTPEEKVAFRAMLEKRRNGMPDSVVLVVAGAAELSELEAGLLHALMMANPGSPESMEREQQLVRLQTRRLRFIELGDQLEAYWKANRNVENRDATLDRAAEAYRAAGNKIAELRVLELRYRASGAGGPWTRRYLELLRVEQPERLVALASGGTLAGEAANVSVASGDVDLALRAIAARGKTLPPVWSNAYTALTGLHYTRSGPDVEGAFRSALGLATIGERLRIKVDRNQQLTGDIWFYYGGRYGEYLYATKQGQPEDYFPAIVEGRAGNASAYFTLAEFYRESGQDSAALADYERSLALDPLRGAAHDRVARILWKQGRREDAIERWRAAIVAFSGQQDQSRFPVTFWGEVRALLEEIGSNRVLAPLRDDADRLLRTYIRRNGTYQIEPLLRGVLAAAGTPRAGIDWIASLSHAAADPVVFLNQIARANWIPQEQKEPLFKAMLDAAAARAAEAQGPAAAFAREQLEMAQIEWLSALVESRQPQRARQFLESLSREVRDSRRQTLAILELRIAAQEGSLTELLERYRREPAAAPQSYELRQAAATLRRGGERAEANQILEFAYSRELERQNFEAQNFLGLAEIRLEQGNTVEAVALLRRMVLLVDQPFSYMQTAATLLEKAKRPAEATEFLEAYAKAAPWDFEGRRRLGLDLPVIAASPEAPYDVRAAAARSSAGSKNLGSGELDLLAQSAITPGEASQPLYYHARVAAASQTTDPAIRIQLLSEALGINPDVQAPRLDLVRAALDAGRPQLAVSGAIGLYQGRGLQYRLNQPQPNIEDVSFLANEFSVHVGSAPIARRLANAYRKLDEPAKAEMLYRISLALEPDAAARASLEAVEREQRTRVENASRRPVISAALEQDHLVRPRVEEVNQ